MIVIKSKLKKKRQVSKDLMAKTFKGNVKRSKGWFSYLRRSWELIDIPKEK